MVGPESQGSYLTDSRRTQEWTGGPDLANSSKPA
jgi:hypothetical protein